METPAHYVPAPPQPRDAIEGFGFISPDDGGAKVFVHRSAAGCGGLQEGDRVEFHLGDGAKGPRAEQVKIL